MYEAKSAEEWRQILVKNLPKGRAWDAATIKGKVLYEWFKCLGIIYADRDKFIADAINGLQINKDCPYLDRYFEALELNRFIVKPKDKDTLAKIILMFLRARKGMFTNTEMVQLVKDIFGFDITINILGESNLNLNIFEAVFPIIFTTATKTDLYYTVVIGFPQIDPDVSYDNYFDKEDPYSAVKQLLRYFINANYKVIYETISTDK